MSTSGKKRQSPSSPSIEPRSVYSGGKTGKALTLDSAVFQRLKELESRIDATISRKRRSVDAALRAPAKKGAKTLRIFVYHEHHNQQPEIATDLTLTDPPSWTLRIEGKLLDGQDKHHKFTKFFRKIVIELDYVLYPKEPIVEWTRPANAADSDGFELQRQGDKESKIRISFYRNHSPERYTMSHALREIVLPYLHGNPVDDTKPNILTALWRYIQANNLQDPESPKVIRSTDKLERVFGVGHLEFPVMLRKLNEHLGPAAPITVDYTITLDGSGEADRNHDKVIDIEVEFDELKESDAETILESSTKVWADSQKQIKSIDDQINSAISSINSHRQKRDFMLSFAGQPCQFIHDFIEWQSSELQTLALEEERDVLLERLGSHYDGPWVDEAVSRYLFNASLQS